MRPGPLFLEKSKLRFLLRTQLFKQDHFFPKVQFTSGVNTQLSSVHLPVLPVSQVKR